METRTCPGCGEENPAKFRLCGFCGTSLEPAPETITCVSCGEENPSRFRLCGFCGTPLAAAGGVAAGPAGATIPSPPAAPAAAPPAPVLPPTEVRKFVTLVFTDLKDSTALTASIDNEAMNEIKARYFSTMATEIERHGGRVEKNIGDAIMAVFGLIRAHEDDALRAVRAAHGMQAALARLNEDLQRFYGVTITNRTGVNTGEIVANTDPNATQNLATGDAVNVAARLEQNAPAGEILMGEVTWELVKAHVEAERQELMLKGKAEPVPAYRLVGLLAQPVVEGPDTAAPFVGRDEELAVLQAAFAEVGTERRPRLVTVIGDAGVGKTRLIADFVRDAAETGTVVRGRCLAYGDGITFWPLLEIVREAARIGEDDSAEVARTRIAGLLQDDADRESIVDRVASAIGLADSSHPVAELFWGTRRLLEALAATRPIVVVIDDVHWAETTFLDFLEHVVTSARDAPILILCSARPEVLDDHAAWVDQAGGVRIDLKPLGEAAVALMIDRLLEGEHLAPDTRRKVVEAAEGNPLYIEQIVSMLRERGTDGDVVVPPTIHALLAARLDSLTREERAIVDPASVIGLVFPEPAIAELVPAPIRPSVPGYLASLDRKQIVHPLAGDGDDPSFRFHHILVRDATYQSLLKRARATLHERFVEWAEKVNRERGRETEFEEILAYHLEQAVRYRSELGPLDESGRSIATRAATKLGSAGRRAFARGDLPAAANLLRRSVDLLDPDDPARLRLETDLGESLYEAGDFAGAGAVLDAAIAAADRIADAGVAARARLTRLLLSIYAEEAAGASQVADAVPPLLETLTAADDEAGVALGWRVLGVAHATAGRYLEAADAAQRVVEHARRAGDARLASRAAAGYATIAMAGTTPARDVDARCSELLEQVSGDRKAEATILGIVAVAAAMLGDADRARELHARARTILDELGPSVTAASTSIEGARIALLAGDRVGAEAALRADDAALEAIGEHYFRSTIVAILAHVLVELDHLDDAERYATLAADLADEDDTESQVLWRAARARLLAAHGNTAAAVALAEEAVELVDATENIDLQGSVHHDLALIHRASGDEEGAGVAFAAALERYERKGNAAAVAVVRSQVGEAAAI